MVTLIDPGRLDPAGLFFIDEWKNTANGVIFGQGLISHQHQGQWWQYAAWYGSNRKVKVARKDPTGVWETVTLDIPIPTNDSHDSIALGISTLDGRLHLAAGGHNEPIKYTRIGLLDPWTVANWSTPSDTLAGTTIGDTTYPTFTSLPNGGLLFWYRNGGSSNGRLRLARYDGETWTVAGDVTSSTGTYTATFKSPPNTSATRGFYWVPPLYSDGKVHLIGTWREGDPDVVLVPYAGVIANHHAVYVYSEDDGLTWRNNNGTLVAATGSDPISVADVNTLVDNATDTRYGLQVPTMATGPNGLIGYLPDYVRGSNVGSDGAVSSETERVQKTGQHPRFRSPITGAWTARTVSVNGTDVLCQYPTGRAGRGQMVFGPDSTMYVFYTGFRVYSAPPPNYNNWTLRFWGPDYLNAFGEAQIDRSREAEGRVSFLYIEEGAGSTAAVCVRDFILD